MKHHSARFPNTRDDLELNGFKVYRVKSHENILQTYRGKDVYKISLLSGKGVIHYSNKKVVIDGSVLVVAKPGVTISWNINPAKITTGYICVFTEKFLHGECFHWLEQSRLLNTFEASVLEFSSKESNFFASFFQRMIQDQSILYAFKSELIRNQISVFMHEAQRRPSLINPDHYTRFKTSIATLYIDLFEMQFPLEGQVIFKN
jgi:AraC family transcriptional activator of pobA